MMPTIAVCLVALFTSILGVTGLRFARTTSNFYVASRAVHPVWNAFAVCGEALSAASFLGAPALLLVYGADMLWALYGWGIGFLLLSLFIAAPVRRFGSYTIPEFIEGRLDSPSIRPVAAGAVIVISFLYLLGQLKGAGEVVRELTGAPYWVGVVAVGLVVAVNLSAGGMRGITFVQGFQFFFIFLGILVPFSVISVLWTADDIDRITTEENLVFTENTTVEYPGTIRLDVEQPASGVVEGTIDGAEVSGPVQFEEGLYEIGADTVIDWPAGAAVPHVEGLPNLSGREWAQPPSPDQADTGATTYRSFAIFIANLLGIMGLPHIVIRFYTNPTGRSARRTNLWAVAMIMPYYAMLPAVAATGRLLGPGLVSNGTTDAVTIVVGNNILDGQNGELLGAIVAAGATAAFLSTASGILITMAGAVSHDMLGAGIPQFRRAVWGGAIAAAIAGIAVQPVNIAVLIGWSTSFSASSICPLLVLGIWWPGLTRRGAYAAVIVGALLNTGAVALSLSGLLTGAWPAALVQVPAVWTAPAAFLAAIIVSRRDGDRVASIGYKFALMHVPDRRTPLPEKELA